MKIYLAADHAGFELKTSIAKELAAAGHEVVDLGAQVLAPEDDYPEYMLQAAKAVTSDLGTLAIVFGGSGQGEAMAANRVDGARAAVFYGHQHEIVKLAREHNDANILSIGARFVSQDEAIDAINVFISTPFSGDERHVRRLAQF
ncbi:MAG: RpiB/LacA/LacB family sugar-phosphate isomerase [Candidatus Pacebacteria bacterium]|nr:RpiB/LacA/LacB family sugar-phosphate isomerase [Candidatus Paceibacterota bacterium]MBP9851973.1 RpiB/LacA/LacB family sugar-phosphate isomerase [Candidatus Paceibacterota bacterium]